MVRLASKFEISGDEKNHVLKVYRCEGRKQHVLGLEVTIVNAMPKAHLLGIQTLQRLAHTGRSVVLGAQPLAC